MKNRYLIAVMVTMAVATGATQPAPGSADVALEEARKVEVFDGDLPAAIEQYRRIADRYATADRTAAARALVRMADAYRKLGDPKSRQVYEFVERNYTDQPAALAAARAARPLTPSAYQAPRRLLADGTIVNSLRADGLAAVGQRRQPEHTVLDIVGIDLISGSITELVTSTASAYGLLPILSPDGRQVAYSWLEDSEPGNRSLQLKELRVIGTGKAGPPRSLIRGDAQTTSSITAEGWSADGTMILVSVVQRVPPPAVISKSVGWVALADGRFQPIKQFARDEMDDRLGLSPDGRWIAYAAAPRSGSRERHIVVMDSSGQHSAVAVQMAALNANPIWTPDSSRLLFTSDRSGTTGLWSVSIANGRPISEPTLVQDRFSGRLIGMTTSGNLIYSQPTGGERLVLVLDNASATPGVVSSFIGSHAALSPDGRMVAFYRSRGSDVDVVVRSIDGGQEQAYSRPGLRRRHPLHWLHSSAALVLAVEDSDAFTEGTGGTGSFYQLTLSTRAFTRLAPLRDATTVRSATVGVSPDDSTLYVATRASGPATRWSQIVATDIATGIATPLMSLPEPGFQPTFDPWVEVSPDGSALAIQTYQDAAAHLFTVRTDGTGLQKLHGPFQVIPPDERMHWSPDSQSVLFTQTDVVSREWRLMKIAVGGGAPDFAGLDLTRLSSRLPTPLFRGPGPGHLSLSADGSLMTIGVRSETTQELWVIENLAVRIP